MSEIKIGDRIGGWEVVEASTDVDRMAVDVRLCNESGSRVEALSLPLVGALGDYGAALREAMVARGLLFGGLVAIGDEHHRVPPKEMLRACAEFIALGMQSATTSQGGGAPGKPSADSVVPTEWTSSTTGYTFRMMPGPTGNLSDTIRRMQEVCQTFPAAPLTEGERRTTFARLSAEAETVGAERDLVDARVLPEPLRSVINAAENNARYIGALNAIVPGLVPAEPDAMRVTWTGGDNSRAAIHARTQSDHPSAVEARRIVQAVTGKPGAAIIPNGWSITVEPLIITDDEDVTWYDAAESGPGIAHLRSLDRPPLSVLVDDPSGDDVAADWRRG